MLFGILTPQIYITQWSYVQTIEPHYIIISFYMGDFFLTVFK